jgi:hypothetical protein
MKNFCGLELKRDLLSIEKGKENHGFSSGFL